MKRLISVILTLILIVSIASISFVTSNAANPYLTTATVKQITSNIIGKTFIKPDGTTCKLTSLVDSSMSSSLFSYKYPYVFEGACSDGIDFYFSVAHQVPSSKTPSDFRKNGYIIKYDVSADKWYVSNALAIGHSNDICYNRKRNVIVSCNYAPAESSVDLINPDLTYNSRVAIKDASDKALKISQISYDDVNDRYIVTSRYEISGSYYHFVLDSNFKYVKKFKRITKPSGYGVQGSDCTKDYVLVTYSDNTDKTDNKVIVMDWSGTKIQTVTIPVKQEIEDMFHIGDLFFMNFHLKTAGGYFYRGSFTSTTIPEIPVTKTFTLKFNANGGTGTMENQTAVCGGTTQTISANTFTHTNYVFKGWNAHRKSDNTWHYKSADGSQNGWYAEGEQPTGYEKYVYADKQVCGSQTSTDNDVVTLYAVWGPMCGDIDSSGVVNISDVTIVQKALASITEVADLDIDAADVDADGKITIRDATYIQLYISKRLTKFPASKGIVYYPACPSTCETITEGLNAIGVDSSYEFRKQIAAINDITNYSGTAEQNIDMLNRLKQGVLIQSK